MTQKHPKEVFRWESKWHTYLDQDIVDKYIPRLICFFIGHDWGRMWRIERKGEHAHPGDAGLVRVSPEKCSRCWKNRWGLPDEDD